MSVTTAVRSLLGVWFVAIGLALPTFADPPTPAPEGDEPKPAPSRAEPEIKPLPLTPIPDDPLPHEGALIDLPYIIEPPDLLLIEVLEALPGRPISGERLVRPDGTVNLGFYGNVQVRGLTLPQAKEKIVRHLRTYLSDDTLGLYQYVNGEFKPFPPGDGPPKLEVPPGLQEPREKAKTPSSAITPTDPGAIRKVRQAATRRASQPTRSHPKPLTAPRLIAQAEPRMPSPPAVAPENLPVPDLSRSPYEGQMVPPAGTPGNQLVLPPGSNVRITIEIQSHPGNSAGPPTAVNPPEELPMMAPEGEEGKWELVNPADTNRVFLDVSAWNSKVYFVLGDIASPGRLPCTGNETVLDALNHAGGFIPSADPKNVRLVRPARGGKPAKVYPIDYEAIVQRGEARANLQLFPGDRLVVGRNEVVQKTIDLDRIAAPFQTMVHSMLQYSFMARALAQISSPSAAGLPVLPPSQREAIIKEWVDLWLKSAARPGVPVLDEKTFREMLERNLNPPKTETKDEKK